MRNALTFCVKFYIMPASLKLAINSSLRSKTDIFQWQKRYDLIIACSTANFNLHLPWFFFFHISFEPVFVFSYTTFLTTSVFPFPSCIKQIYIVQKSCHFSLINRRWWFFSEERRFLLSYVICQRSLCISSIRWCSARGFWCSYFEFLPVRVFLTRTWIFRNILIISLTSMKGNVVELDVANLLVRLRYYLHQILDMRYTTKIGYLGMQKKKNYCKCKFYSK